MGIFRAGVRVTRALTPPPSSSSSDDEESRARKKRKTKNNAGAQHSIGRDGTEVFQVGDTSCQLPVEIFDLPHLNEVLSLDIWNSCLSEEERQRLGAYLPAMDQESYGKTLMELFGSQNMHFGCPLEVLWQSLKEGSFDPDTVKTHQTLMLLQRKQYYHDLRQYHNGMVNSLVEMRELWASDPEANLEERLSAWSARKASEAEKDASGALKASADILQMNPLLRPSRIVDADVRNHGDPVFYPTHGLLGNEGDVAVRGPDLNNHLDFDSRQDRKLQDSLLTEMEKDRCLGDTISVGPCEFDRKRRSSKGKRQFDDREIGGRTTSEELMIGAQVKADCTPLDVHSAQRKVELEDRISRPVKWHNRGMKDSVFPEYKEAQRPSLVRAQYDSHRDIRLKGSEVAAKEMNTSASMKKCNNRAVDMRLAQNSEQDDLGSLGNAALSPRFASASLFSTLHLLSAVRAALVDGYDQESGETDCLPLKRIVRRVKECPGDPRVLEVQLPLDELVRGALKTLSSTSKKLVMPKPFVVYDRSIRCWSWVGPVTGHSRARQQFDSCSFSELWSTSAAVLDELEVGFLKWLIITEKTLYQLWQLASLPLPTYPVLPDEQERFRDLRAQKSLTTIFPSSYEMRALFRKEERIRYSALGIAFRYTTVDGHKAAVVPLRRMGSKSKSKARDHFMLKADRPSHITILCLVRDAAARLPQSIGTRADVCILLRDSQFIVEDVPELQLSQVVSGALDRLHYEKDPCVRYDSDKKLWLYLHGDREEEDFEEGGTASTRSSRRTKKDGASFAAQGSGFNDDMSEPEPDSGSFDGNGDVRDSESPEHQTGGPGSMVPGPVSGHTREEVLLPFIPASMQPFCGNMQSHPMGWEVYKAGKELSMTQ